MLKKYGIYILLAVLALLALVYYVSDRKGTLDSSSANLALDDTTGIDRIELRYDTLVLELYRQGTNWRVNNYMARNQAVEALIANMHNLEVVSPLSGEALTTAQSEFQKKALQVTFFKQGFSIHSISVISGLLKSNVCMQAFDSDACFLVESPGNSEQFAQLFTVDPYFWRDNHIFRFSASQISSVCVEQPLHSVSSFCIRRNQHQLELLQIPDDLIETDVDEAKMAHYLQLFQHITFKGVMASKPTYLNPQPDYTITLTDTDGKLTRASFFPIVTDVEKKKIDLNNLYVFIENDTLPVVARYADIDPLLQEIDYFLK